MIKKAIAKVWTMLSSNGHTEYETLQYTDGSASCNCPGWTRHVKDDGSRSCKHIRAVDMGSANQMCERMHDYEAAKETAPVAQEPAKPTTPPPAKPKKKSSNIPVARKISWK